MDQYLSTSLCVFIVSALRIRRICSTTEKFQQKTNELLKFSGELRPDSKPSSFAYPKTANISVSSCYEYSRSTKITKMVHFDNYQKNNMQISL